MEQRKMYYAENGASGMIPAEGVEKHAVACLPIISAGDVTGAVAFLDDGSGATVNHCQKTLIQAASQFLGKQLES